MRRLHVMFVWLTSHATPEKDMLRKIIIIMNDQYDYHVCLTSHATPDKDMIGKIIIIMNDQCDYHAWLTSHATPEKDMLWSIWLSCLAHITSHPWKRPELKSNTCQHGYHSPQSLSFWMSNVMIMIIWLNWCWRLSLSSIIVIMNDHHDNLAKARPLDL